jgi:hypothetical protein
MPHHASTARSPRRARLGSRRTGPADGEAGFAMLLTVGMLGLLFGLVLVYVGMATHDKALEGQLARTRAQLQTADESAIRTIEQDLRAGFLRADCAARTLRAVPGAPVAVKRRYASGRMVVHSCNPRTLKGAVADAVFDAAGHVPRAMDCAPLTTRVAVKAAAWDERTIVVAAETDADAKNPLYGDLDPVTTRARIALPPPRVPGFALLANDLHCGLCHVRVNGDVASLTAVTKLHEFRGLPWAAQVAGAWYAAAGWDPSGGVAAIAIAVRDGVRRGYHGPRLPGHFVKTGLVTTYRPEFPRADFAASAVDSGGNGADPFGCTTPAPIERPGNVVLTGKSAADPIVLDGDLHVSGDLVISGWYRGVGTIYVDGNVYIPFDLRAVRSIFPYDADPKRAELAAQRSVETHAHDALAIATRRSVIVGEFDDNGAPNKSVWYHELTPPSQRGDQLGIKDLYAWYPGGKAGYEALFGVAYDCIRRAPAGHRGSINLIEAYLYAQGAVGGLARGNSYSINGGVIADSFHFVSAAGACVEGLHPVHKQAMTWSYINYDLRLKHGLPLLGRFAAFFTPP